MFTLKILTKIRFIYEKSSFDIMLSSTSVGRYDEKYRFGAGHHYRLYMG